MSIEEKVTSTILDKETGVKVSKTMYKVSSPSIATLIEVSRLIAKLPFIDGNAENFFAEALRNAKDCEVLGDIAATLILGYKPKSRFRNLFYITKRELKYRKLKVEILNMSPKDLNKLISNLLAKMEISDFFGLTISLSEVNLLKPSKEMGETIASGQR